MARSPDAIQAALEKLDRDLRIRDQSLVRSFDILTTEIKRLQSMVAEQDARERLPMAMTEFIELTTEMLTRQRELLESLRTDVWPDDPD